MNQPGVRQFSAVVVTTLTGFQEYVVVRDDLFARWWPWVGQSGRDVGVRPTGATAYFRHVRIAATGETVVVSRAVMPLIRRRARSPRSPARVVGIAGERPCAFVARQCLIRCMHRL